MTRPIWVLAAVAIALGCSGDAPDSGPPSDSAAEPPASDTAAPFTREALDVQPQMAWLQQHTPAAMELKPGTTPWRPMERPAEPAITDSTQNRTPGAVLATLAHTLGWSDMLGEGAWEQTTRVWFADEENAIGVVMLWGFMDDAVAGRDLRAQLRRIDGTWHAERLEERFHCRRAVSADGVCS